VTVGVSCVLFCSAGLNCEPSRANVLRVESGLASPAKENQMKLFIQDYYSSDGMIVDSFGGSF